MKKSFSNILLIMASIAFISIIGAAVYEHAAVVPVWSIAPPRSLAMFQGEYGIKPENFWMPVHPVTILLLAAALATNWKQQRRQQILIVFCGYLLILVITAAYFVPELVAITTSAYSTAMNSDLAARASTREMLSLLRLSTLLILAATLLRSLSIQTEVR